MKSAAAVVAALSRPASQKAGAWTKEDPEAAKEKAPEGKPENEAEPEGKKKKRKAKTELEAIIEEEMEQDKQAGSQDEPQGCWVRLTKSISSKFVCPRAKK